MNCIMRTMLFVALSVCGGMLYAKHATNDGMASSGHAYRMIQTKSELAESLGSSKPVIIKVYASWCGACSAMEEAFNGLAKQYKDNAVFIAVDFDNEETKSFAKSLGVDSLPTIIIKKVGASSKADLEQQVRAALGLGEQKVTVFEESIMQTGDGMPMVAAFEEEIVMPVEEAPVKKSSKKSKKYNKKKNKSVTVSMDE